MNVKLRKEEQHIRNGTLIAFSSAPGAKAYRACG
jgi:hypothetical protein